MGQRLVEPVEGLLLVALIQLAYRPAHAPGILVFRQAGVAGQCVESGQVGFHLFQMSGGDGIVAAGSRDIQFYGKVGGALGFLLGQPQVTEGFFVGFWGVGMVDLGKNGVQIRQVEVYAGHHVVLVVLGGHLEGFVEVVEGFFVVEVEVIVDAPYANHGFYRVAHLFGVLASGKIPVGYNRIAHQGRIGHPKGGVFILLSHLEQLSGGQMAPFLQIAGCFGKQGKACELQQQQHDKQGHPQPLDRGTVGVPYMAIGHLFCRIVINQLQN